MSAAAVAKWTQRPSMERIFSNGITLPTKCSTKCFDVVTICSRTPCYCFPNSEFRAVEYIGGEEIVFFFTTVFPSLCFHLLRLHPELVGGSSGSLHFSHPVPHSWNEALCAACAITHTVLNLMVISNASQGLEAEIMALCLLTHTPGPVG